MSTHHDVIILGLGAMGSAAAYHLARRGRTVLGVDRFVPPHAMGSSHGQTRIIREAYFEDPAYVPLVQRAYALWQELEYETGTRLLFETGGLMLGRPESELVRGALLSAQTHRLAHEVLTGAEVERRFPALRPGTVMVGVYEPRAGILFPEACIRSHLTLAAASGATVRVNEPVQSWRADNDGVSVTTGHATYRGSQLIVAAGAWAGELLAEITPPLAVERQVLLWFEPAQGGAAFSAASCPVHLWQFDDGQFMYGFPDLGDGVKIARHHGGRITTADTVERGVAASEVDDMRGLLRQYVPGADGPLRATAVCLYTNTPDQHFWIDRHPAHANVLIASPCSGHGFKFAGVIGEALADLATGASPAVDLSLFRSRWPAGRSLRADGQEKPGRS